MRRHLGVRLFVPTRNLEWGVVSEHHEVCSLEAERSIHFRPPAVVAQCHADLETVHLEDTEAQIPDLEVSLLQMLMSQLRAIVRMAGQMDLSVLTDDAAGTVDENGRVEVLSVVCELCVSEIETDPELFGR